MANQIISEEYADLIIEDRNRSGFIFNYRITSLGGGYSMVNIPVQEIDKCSLSTYGYRAFPSCFTTQSLLSLDASGITQLQRRANLRLFGQGVLVGIIDTGIEYTHEAFINEDNTSRIVSIWDQTINEEGNYQKDFGYGKEFTNEMINLALLSEQPLDIVPSTDEVGHGTGIAGIIAGKESRDKNFRGVVPEAQLVVVKLKKAKNISKSMFEIPEQAECYQETDIMTAVTYLKQKASELKMPIVMCIALGTSQGGHDGRGAISSYLSSITDITGVAVVLPAGNEGNARRHYFGSIVGNNYYDEFEIRVGKNETGFSMEIWETAPDRLAIGITTPSGNYIESIYPSINACRILNPSFEKTTIWVNNFMIEAQTGDQLIVVRLQNPTEGIWSFRLSNIDRVSSNYHAWLPSEGLVSNDTYFIESNPDTTITSPGNAEFPITVTAYNQENNSIILTSSRGFNRVGYIKPDIAAPGMNIPCPILGNRYGTMTGSGAATAHAAGVAAMLFQWGIVEGNNNSMDGIQIKTMLLRGAKRSPEGTINNVWGYGIINIYGVFERF